MPKHQGSLRAEKRPGRARAAVQQPENPGKGESDMLHIVLHQPEQPGNVGTIGRSCVCAGAALHLIEPLGFHMTDRHIRRAGLDYWPRLRVSRHMNYEAFLEEEFEEARKAGSKLWFVTTKARQTYADVNYGPEDYLMFGKESAGIPEEILVGHPEQCIRIPMAEGERSLNLSNSVSIVLYEAMRQQRFAGLIRTGELHHLSWI